MKENNHNVDAEEIHKFDKMAEDWWNPQGDMKPLHQLNPVRLNYVQEYINLNAKKVLDVGCGGGILSEAMAQAGAQVSAIDLSAQALTVAKQHAQENNLNIDYQKISTEDFAQQQPHTFDAVICMEMLEHVPNPESIIKACSALTKPDGLVFFSTINRNLKSYLMDIVAAEYILQLLPKGTHEYEKFIRPSELVNWSRPQHLDLQDIRGIAYQLKGSFKLSKNTDGNYITCFKKISQP